MRHSEKLAVSDRVPLTPRQTEVMAEYAHHGLLKLAADCLGIALPTMKNHLTTVHAKTGQPTTLESFRALGWLRAPATRRHG